MQIEKAFHCQFCSLKKYDFKTGTTCGLTNKIPDFNITCPDIKFKNHNFDFSEIKQNYFNSNNNLSSGFYSLWLIPKIS